MTTPRKRIVGMIVEIHYQDPEALIAKVSQAIANGYWKKHDAAVSFKDRELAICALRALHIIPLPPRPKKRSKRT